MQLLDVPRLCKTFSLSKGLTWSQSHFTSAAARRGPNASEAALHHSAVYTVLKNLVSFCID